MNPLSKNHALIGIADSTRECQSQQCGQVSIRSSCRRFCRHKNSENRWNHFRFVQNPSDGWGCKERVNCDLGLELQIVTKEPPKIAHNDIFSWQTQNLIRNNGLPRTNFYKSWRSDFILNFDDYTIKPLVTIKVSSGAILFTHKE